MLPLTFGNWQSVSASSSSCFWCRFSQRSCRMMWHCVKRWITTFWRAVMLPSSGMSHRRSDQLLDAEDEISTILRSSVTTNRYVVKSHKTLIFSVEVHYRLHKTTPFDPVRSRMNPASFLHHTVVSSTLILFSRLCLYLPSGFCPSSFTSITAYVPFICAMTCLCHIPWFRLCDGIWRPSNVRSLSVHVPVPGPLFSATQFFL